MMEVRDENTWFTEYLPPNKNNLKFYKEHYYWDLACYVSISDNTVNNKTVHKAKGDEFENVLLVLEKEEDISFLLKPDLEHKNHHRVFYVGISRAEKKLFISVPNITEQQEMDLSKLPIIIKRLHLRIYLKILMIEYLQVILQGTSINYII